MMSRYRAGLRRRGSQGSIRSRLALKRRTDRRGEFGVGDIAGVADARRLDEDDLGLVVCGGAVLDPAWHYDALARSHVDDPVAKFDAEAALPHHEKFVRVV